MSGIRLVARPLHRSASLRRTRFGAVIAVAAIAATVWASPAARHARDAQIMLLYVGADDCAPCRAWQNGEGATFLASADFPRITYREVKSRHLRDVLKDENWPEEIRSFRGSLRRSDGVPLWLVISNNEILEQRFGAAAWRASILPKIESLLR